MKRTIQLTVAILVAMAGHVESAIFLASDAFVFDLRLDGPPDLNDNAPTLVNRGQEDSDGDLIGDAVDVDPKDLFFDSDLDMRPDNQDADTFFVLPATFLLAGPVIFTG